MSESILVGTDERGVIHAATVLKSCNEEDIRDMARSRLTLSVVKGEVTIGAKLPVDDADALLRLTCAALTGVVNGYVANTDEHRKQISSDAVALARAALAELRKQEGK